MLLHIDAWIVWMSAASAVIDRIVKRILIYVVGLFLVEY